MTNNKNIIVLLLVTISIFSCNIKNKTEENNTPLKSEKRTQKIAQGWNTWNTRNVLSHVLLPECFAIDLQLQDTKSEKTLKEVLIGQSRDGEKIIPGPHSYNGSYTQLKVDWRTVMIEVRTASSENDIVILIAPENTNNSGKLIINPQILWGRKGSIKIFENGISMKSKGSELRFSLVSKSSVEFNDTAIICPLSEKIILSTFENKNISELESIIASKEKELTHLKTQYGTNRDLYDAMQTVLAWDVIYEPTHDRIISPVSRIWSAWHWKGWVLFEWDTYFAAYMYSLDNKELAYSNVLAITKSVTPKGFVPNYASARGNSNDRSQPPVGSYVIWKIYERYHEKWLLEVTFNELLSWNRWWAENRDNEGYLCWGSTAYNPIVDDVLDKYINTKTAAKYKSGLDNSPMYDDAPYDSTKNLLLLADVGLMSMYIWDCHNMIEIARELGKTDAIKELEARAQKYSEKLKTLYDEKTGIYLNKNLVTSEFSSRLSPTNFYPLLTGVPSQKQAERMIAEHFYDPDEFWGAWIIPSIARNDKAFEDNDYWRGRIWAPMNFLVYCGLKNYNLPEAQNELVEKSKKLIMKSWLDENHVYENYNSVTGVGDDVQNSDKFYHWGALLAFMSLLENED